MLDESAVPRLRSERTIFLRMVMEHHSSGFDIYKIVQFGMQFLARSHNASALPLMKKSLLRDAGWPPARE
jgi:hypothetical protein